MSSMQTLPEGRAIISLEGDQTLPHAEEMRGLLIKALVNADTVGIRFKEVYHVDLSCLQLLCSAHRSATHLKKRITIECGVPKALKDAADTAGFSRLKGCKRDSDRSCIWAAVEGGNHG
jgi:ABC-type transporter Mla MlaB component